MPEPTMLDAPIAATSAAVDHDANIGADKARALFALMPSVDQRLRQAAAGNADVMVRGEPGSGKELFARALHTHSPRAQASFVHVVCGASANADVAFAPNSAKMPCCPTTGRPRNVNRARAGSRLGGAT